MRGSGLVGGSRVVGVVILRCKGNFGFVESFDKGEGRGLGAVIAGAEGRSCLVKVIRTSSQSRQLSPHSF